MLEAKPRNRLEYAMTSPESSQAAYPKSGLQKLLGLEADLGIAMAADPLNANLPDLHLRVTSLNSAWFARTCKECKDTFREGDQVRLCPKCGEPFHDDGQFSLHCWQQHFAGGKPCKEKGDPRFGATTACDFRRSEPLADTAGVAAAAAGQGPHSAPPVGLVRQFLSGLESVWRPFGEQQTIRIVAGTTLVGRTCPWCRSRVRAGEYAVACPCGCGTYFHQDVFRRLTCWNEWHRKEGNDYCPNTGRRLPGVAS